MREALTGSWHLFVVRGVLALMLGASAMAWPTMTLVAVVLAFGLYALLDGIAALAIAARYIAREHTWLVLLEGLAGVGLGLALLVWARFAAELLVLGIAVWAVATGILEMLTARRLRRELPTEGLLGVAGAASVAMGVAIFLWPTSSSFGLVLIVGSFGLVFGASLLAQGLRLRAALRRLDDTHHGDFGTRPRAV